MFGRSWWKSRDKNKALKEMTTRKGDDSHFCIINTILLLLLLVPLPLLLLLLLLHLLHLLLQQHVVILYTTTTRTTMQFFFYYHYVNVCMNAFFHRNTRGPCLTKRKQTLFKRWSVKKCSVAPSCAFCTNDNVLCSKNSVLCSTIMCGTRHVTRSQRSRWLQSWLPIRL